MDITIAIVFVNGTARTRIEGDCLVALVIGGQDGGELLDTHRRLLQQAFSEIYDGADVEVLFPELNECENLL